jgi:pimeloyl-ACP methyl ester carboxylesterase
MTQPLFEHRRLYGGMQTRVLELEGDGVPFVLFHGFGDSADTWRLMLALFGERGQRAIAVDLPGFGHADILDERRPVLPQLDDFGATVVRDVAADSGAAPIVVGNSLGGLLSMRLAQQADLPIAGIVPIGPAGLDLSRWIQMVETAPLMRSLLAVPAPVPEAVTREIVARLFAMLAVRHPGDLDPKVIAAFTSHYRKRSVIRRYLATGRRLRPELADCFELHKITAPVLSIWGRHDRLVPVSGVERLLAGVPHARSEILEHCGHCPQLEAPERIVRLVCEFAVGDTALAA